MDLTRKISEKIKSLFEKIGEFFAVKYKKISFVLVVVFLFVGIFISYKTVHAGGLENAASGLLGITIGIIISAVGAVFKIFAGLLKIVASFNQFVTPEAIRTSWSAIRDVCNMFFVAILLVIAVASILNIERYNYKKALPKLILMAILINFSLLLTGWLIDISQIVTNSFVNAWGEVSNNLIVMFRVDKLMSISSQAKDIKMMGVAASMILSLVLLIVSIVVIIALTIIFLFRIIAFWILAILSPLAFLAAAAPFTEKYFNQWLEELTKYLIVGPVLAFFLWASMTIAIQNTVIISGLEGLGANCLTDAAKAQSLGIDCSDPNNPKQAATLPASQSPTTGVPTEITQPGNFSGFILSLCLLIGSLAAAQKIGVAGATMAKNFATGAKKFGVGVTKSAAAYGLGRGMERVGGIGALRTRLPGTSALISSWGTDLQKGAVKSTRTTAGKAMAKLGMGKTTVEALSGIAAKREEERKKAGPKTWTQKIKDFATQPGALAGGMIGALAGPGGMALGSIISGGIGGILLGGLAQKRIQSAMLGYSQDETKYLNLGKRKAAELNDPRTGAQAATGYSAAGSYIGAGGVLSKDNKVMLDELKPEGIKYLADEAKNATDPAIFAAFKKMLAAYYKAGNGSYKNQAISNFVSGAPGAGYGNIQSEVDGMQDKVDVASLAGIDDNKYQKTVQLYEKMGKGNMQDFFKSSAYQEGKKDLLPEDEFEAAYGMRKLRENYRGAFQVETLAKPVDLGTEGGVKLGINNGATIPFDEFAKEMGGLGYLKDEKNPEKFKDGVTISKAESPKQYEETMNKLSQWIDKKMAEASSKTESERKPWDNNVLENGAAAKARLQERMKSKDDSIQLTNSHGDRLFTETIIHEGIHSDMLLHDPKGEEQKRIFESNHPAERRNQIFEQMKAITGNKDLSYEDAIGEYYVRAKAKETGYASAEALEINKTESNSIDNLRKKPLSAEVASSLLKPSITNEEKTTIQNIISANPEIRQTVINNINPANPRGSVYSDPMYLSLKRLIEKGKQEGFGKMNLLGMQFDTIKIPKTASPIERQGAYQKAGIPSSLVNEIFDIITEAKK